MTGPISSQVAELELEYRILRRDVDETLNDIATAAADDSRDHRRALFLMAEKLKIILGAPERAAERKAA